MLTSAMRYDNNRDNLTLDLTKCSGMEMLFFWQMSPNNYFPLILLSIGDPLSPPKGHLVLLQRTLNEIKLKQVLKGLLSRTFGSKHTPASAESLGQPVVPLTYLLPTWWKYGAFRTQMLIVPFFLFSSFFNISWWCDCRAIQQWPSCTQLADGWLENNKLLDETRASDSVEVTTGRLAVLGGVGDSKVKECRRCNGQGGGNQCENDPGSRLSYYPTWKQIVLCIRIRRRLSCLTRWENGV